MPLNNYKKRIIRNRDENKDSSNLFEINKSNANVKKTIESY